MIIATFIISCLTLIAVSIGIVLTLKSKRSTLATIAQCEQLITARVENVEAEIQFKLQEFTNNVLSRVDTTKAEIQTTVTNNAKFVHEELIAKIKESNINNYNAIESVRKAILESLEPKINELKRENQSSLESLKGETNQYLLKLSVDLNSKVDTALQVHEKQQNELIDEVNTKFGKIIDEIKRPLTID